MDLSPAARLDANGLILPAVPGARGAYRTWAIAGNVLHLSAHGPFADDGSFTHVGRIGESLTPEEGRAAAAACALSLLATTRAAVGSLNRVHGVLTLRGYVNSVPDFEEHAEIVDGASQILLVAFGEAGRAVRTSVGVAGLPFGLPIVVEAALTLDDHDD